jgi:TonB family protein
LVLAIGPAAPLAAQHVLFAEHNDQYFAVLRAHGNRAFVKAGEKLVLADGRRFALEPAKEYLPVFVAVRNIDVHTRYLDLSGSAINNEFDFRASLETPYRLKDVFVVLELNLESAGKLVFLQEVGDLSPHEPRTIDIGIPLMSKLGSGNYVFHLFSQGVEVLQSEIPDMERDAAVDRMIAARLPAGPEAAPQVFIGPEPVYPSGLLKAKVKGRAMLTLRIGANGRVYDPALQSATDPAFGEAALAAVRLWRFLPRMKHGQPVDTTVVFPVDFVPPAPPAAKS